MNTSFISRRALNAGLATSLVLGPGAWRSAFAQDASRRVERLADAVFEESLALFPMSTTENFGDARYEGAFEIEIAPAHVARQRRFHESVLARLRGIPKESLDANARLTYDLLEYDATDRLSTLIVPWHLMPVGHVDSMPVKLSQWAGGDAAQPMKTVANYDHFLARLKKLPAWIDQAIVNMREGIARGVTLPRQLVERTLPQYDTILPANVDESPYLAAMKKFPESIAPAQRKRIAAEYRAVVTRSVIPSVEKLRTFLRETYLPAARTTAGFGGMPGGAQWYRAQLKSFTTTSMTPAQVHELGLREVERIRGEMDKLKAKFNFEGDLDAFIQTTYTRPEFTPFKTEEEVIAEYRRINDRVKPQLPRLFERAPKAALEIKAIEPVRRETASDNYVPPASDGSRPGVFYAVVNDPAKYRRTTMTSLFLHEGQPGHHYQIGLQREMDLSKYRQATWYDAYGEGWALYAESLGGELGVYDDPVALLGRLFMELHRALRLVVDTGLHDKGWSHAQTIAYLRSKEGSTEDSARNATERYMAWAGQACAYKVGELKILQLRERARSALGGKFDIRQFHTQLLGNGCLPLAMLETKIDKWIAASRKV
jgi:uncharacterized protein (DUF885 family)